MNEIGRKHPVHTPVYERHNTPVIVFLTVCTKNRKSILANDSVHQLLRAAWQIQPSWLVGQFCNYAQSCPPILRSCRNASAAAYKMGEFLEITLGASLAAPRRRTDLATPFLGYATAPR
jgi:hypothetical protein